MFIREKFFYIEMCNNICMKIEEKLSLIKRIAKLHHFVKMITEEKYVVEIPCYNERKNSYELHRHKVYDITNHFELMLTSFEKLLKEHFESALKISVGKKIEDLLKMKNTVSIYSTFKPYHIISVSLILLFISIYFSLKNTLLYTILGAVTILLSLYFWIKSMRIKFIVLFRPFIKNEYSSKVSPVIFKYIKYRKSIFSLVTIIIYYPMIYEFELADIQELKAFISVLSTALDNIFVIEYAYQKLLEQSIEIEHLKKLLKHYQYLANVYKEQANKYLEAYEEVASEMPIKKKRKLFG